MSQTIILDDKSSPLLGAAIGMTAGLVASYAMNRFQAAVCALSSSSGGAEPATDKAADKVSHALTGKPLSDKAKPLAGQAVHYALGGGLGALYGLAAEYRPAVTTGYGAVFGTGVAGVLDEAAVPAAGLGSPPWQTAARTHAYTVASHVVFGTVAELVRRQLRAFAGRE